MTRQGSQWIATLGPFAGQGTVAFQAAATDTGGFSATAGPGSVGVGPC